MNPIIVNVGVAAATGFGRSLLGYLAVMQTESFSAKKFVLGAATGIIAGAIAGSMAADVKMAIIGALAGDDIRSAAVNFYKNK